MSIESPLPARSPIPSRRAAALCPFHDGAQTLDILLAEISPRDRPLLDAALDLRALLMAGEDASECLYQLFQVRALLEQRHYLAFYRVRCWIARRIEAHVRAEFRGSWKRCPLPLGGARYDEVVNSCLAQVAADGVIPPQAEVRFVFAAPVQAAVETSRKIG